MLPLSVRSRLNSVEDTIDKEAGSGDVLGRVTKKKYITWENSSREQIELHSTIKLIRRVTTMSELWVRWGRKKRNARKVFVDAEVAWRQDDEDRVYKDKGNANCLTYSPV